MKYLFHILLVLTTFGIKINGIFVPSCTGVQYTGDIHDPKTNETLFSYSFNIQVTKSKDLIFRNLIHFSNFSFTPLQKTDYKLKRLEYMTSWKYCDSVEIPTEDNTFYYMDQELRFILIVGTDDNQSKTVKDGCTLEPGDSAISITIGMFVMDGEIFNSENGQFFDSTNNFCFNSDKTDPDTSFNYSNRTVCCTNFDNMQIPNLQNEVCTNFESNITVISKGDVYYYYYINVIYSLMHDIFSYSVIASSFEFEVSPPCESDPAEFNPNCSMSLPTSGDFYYQLNLPSLYGSMLVGQLIRRNGMFFMNKNISLTSSNPCWIHTSYIFHPGTKMVDQASNSTFCCTNFVVNAVPYTTESSEENIPTTEIVQSTSADSTTDILITKVSNTLHESTTTTKYSSASKLFIFSFTYFLLLTLFFLSFI